MTTRRTGRRRRITSRSRAQAEKSTLAVIAAALLAAGAGFHQGVTAYAHTSATPKLAPSTGVPQPSPSLAPEARVGSDYSFLATVDGRPIHWPCTQPIAVELVGPVPQSASAALDSIVTKLRSATHLPLNVVPTGTAVSSNPSPMITVRYAPNGTRIGDLALESPTELGVGGPTWSQQFGVIISGEVLIRDDTPDSDPVSPMGRHVLMHELGHALGLGHSAPNLSEIMAPVTQPGDGPNLGGGDLAALAQLGCA